VGRLAGPAPSQSVVTAERSRQPTTGDEQREAERGRASQSAVTRARAEGTGKDEVSGGCVSRRRHQQGGRRHPVTTNAPENNGSPPDYKKKKGYQFMNSDVNGNKNIGKKSQVSFFLVSGCPQEVDCSRSEAELK